MAADRRGFALVFVVVTLAVMLILATVVLSNTASGRQRDRIIATTSALLRFKSEIGSQTNQPSYFGDVKLNPGLLSHLFVQIATTDSNACGQPYAGPDVNKFLGPYHLVTMVRRTQYQIEPGIILEDTLQRVPTTGPGNQAAILQLVMNNVAIADAQDLGAAMDGITTGAGPNITFTPAGSNPVTVYYNVPIVGC